MILVAIAVEWHSTVGQLMNSVTSVFAQLKDHLVIEGFAV